MPREEIKRIWAPAKVLGDQEALRMANELYEEYGDQHINFAKVYRVVSDRPPQWAVLYKDDIPLWMHDLLVYGLAVESRGPRGGKGWKLTGRKEPKLP